jgi:CspA family cold shock protein
MRGTLKRKTDRGFGFIAPDDAQRGRDEHFLHASNLLGGIRFEDLKVGDVIEFDSEKGERGLLAVNAQLVGGE